MERKSAPESHRRRGLLKSVITAPVETLRYVTAAQPTAGLGIPTPTPTPVPGILTVTKLADTDDGVCDTDCSLREAIAAAASGDTVAFAPGLSGTITLILGHLNVFQGLTIQGPGALLQKSQSFVILSTSFFSVNSAKGLGRDGGYLSGISLAPDSSSAEFILRACEQIPLAA